jgi:adenosylhomocysteine nucleosidase
LPLAASICHGKGLFSGSCISVRVAHSANTTTVITCGVLPEQWIASRYITSNVIRGSGREPISPEQLASGINAQTDLCLSFGVAGGLQPGLPAGTLLIPKNVIDGDGNVYACDPAVAEAFRAARIPFCEDPIFGSDCLQQDQQKQRLFQETAAAAVDLESHRTAQAAKERGINFAALRVVVDTPEQPLPPAALVPFSGFMKSVMKEPGQLPDLYNLTRNFITACVTLRRAAQTYSATMR